MVMYIKLQQNFLKESCDNWDKFKSDNLVTQFVSGNISLEYYSLENVDAFRNQHLKKFYTIRPSRVLFTEINGTGFLNPHIDHNTNVTLNYYIQSIDDVTTFYETNNNIIGFNYGNRDQSNIYDVGDLSVKSEFVANNNTAYLLDVSKIHSVTKTSILPRKFISYQWKNHTFDEVLQDLIEVNPDIVLS
jgi:hypothetical protein